MYQSRGTVGNPANYPLCGVPSKDMSAGSTQRSMTINGVGHTIHGHYFSDLGNDLVDNWGYFSLINEAGVVFPIPFTRINGPDGTMYTENIVIDSSVFSVKHGWTTRGIFLIDITPVNHNRNFRFRCGGNWGEEERSRFSIHGYSHLSYNFYGLRHYGRNDVEATVYVIPKNTVISGYGFTADLEVDNQIITSQHSTNGFLMYLIKGTQPDSGFTGYQYLLYDLISVAKPNPPASVTRPSPVYVGDTITLSWTPSPLPTQPSGVVLTENKVFYQIDYYNGTTWVNISAKSGATSINIRIPSGLNATNAMFKITPFVVASGMHHYGGAKFSDTMVVYLNTPPTAPSLITTPVAGERLRVGQSYTLAWRASSDANGNPITYEVQYFNGQSLTNVITGTNSTTRVFVIPSGDDTQQAYFRVRAYDGREFSPWTLSGIVEIFNNTPPNTPKPFSSPQPSQMFYTNQAVNLTWGAATATIEDRTISYQVQYRLSNVSPWTDASTTNIEGTSFLWTVPANAQDSATAQVRVRAYDGYDFGGWIDSNVFSITGNIVTNTSGFREEIRDRIAVNQELRLSWSAAETSRNTAIVYDLDIFNGFTWIPIASNIQVTSITFKIPEMLDTPAAKLRVRSKTAFGYGGYIYSEWRETTTFAIMNFFVYEEITLPFPNDIQKKENIDYLRQKVNDMLAVNAQATRTFTDEVIIRFETAIKHVHFDEIEKAILECYNNNSRASFSNSKTEREIRTVKTYSDQSELLQHLPQRFDTIRRALTNS